MLQLFTFVLFLTGSVGLRLPGDSSDVEAPDPVPREQRDTLHENAEKAAVMKLADYEKELTNDLLKAQGPFLCPSLEVQTTFDLDSFIASPWYSQMEQPLNNDYETMKCRRVDFRKKDNLESGYEMEVYNQAFNVNTGESGNTRLCSQQVDGGKLRLASCDSNPEYASAPYWILHYEEGPEGFVVVAGGDPYVPLRQSDEREGGGWVCGYLNSVSNNGGLWFMTREPRATDAAFTRAREIIAEAGLPWEIMAGVDQNGCNYLNPDDTATSDPSPTSPFRK